MVQTSAAREPSMEEILASIRRIIETNDAASPDRGDSRPQLAAVSEVPAAAQPQNTQVDNHPQPQAAQSAAAARTISLADVAARLRSAPDAQPIPAAAAPAVEDEVARAMTADSLQRFDSEELDVAEDDAANDHWNRLADEEHFEEPADGSDWPDLDALDQSASVLHLHEHAAEKAQDTRTSTEQKGGELISSAAGAKVAAAFEDLNEAVVRGQMRSFDDIAEDMLRPMLKDWLDDNLPTLVERLVREEIERVARGGRR
ncbi:hypothetical protein GCM10007908_27770 [Rhizobium albus]|nr:hypothetical protein GCM10007908_27770 [Rhizobium albus]